MSEAAEQNRDAAGAAPEPTPGRGQGTPGCAWVGLAFCLLLTGWLWREVFRVMLVYRETTCTILEKEVRRGEGDEDAVPGYLPWFRFTHELDGRSYEATGYEARPYEWGFRADVEAIVARYRIGERARCWYDPQSPGKALLARFSGLVSLTVPLLMTAITAVLAAVLLWPLLPQFARTALRRRAGVEGEAAGDASFRWFLGCLGAGLLGWNVFWAWLTFKSWQEWRAGFDDGKLLLASVVLAVTWIAQLVFARDWRRQPGTGRARTARPRRRRKRRG